MREFRPPVRPSKVRQLLVVLVAIFVVVPTAIVGTLAFSTSAITYTIANGALTVRSGGLFSGRRTVALSDIEEVRTVHLSRGRRTAGTGLPGYCVGKFWYPELGAVWQATDCGGRAVVLRLERESRPIVLTPPDRGAFLKQLEGRVPGTITLPPPPKGALYILAAVVIPVTLVVAGMVGPTLAFGPRCMRYLVGDGALTVETIFGKKRWPTRGARAKAYMPGKMWRVWGTMAPGYFSGLYREEGTLTRVYATGWESPVLFEGEARVILSPEDREGFLKALAEEGVSVAG